MYWPSTLSCAWPCGALALGAGPPLPPVVAIDSTLSLPTTAAVGGVANTGAPVGQGYHAPRLDLRRRRRPRAGIWCHSPGSSSMTRSSRGVRRETARQRCESCNGPPANRRQQQRGAQEVRYKTWKYQKDSADHRCHARRFQMQGSNPVPGEGGAQAVEIGASEPSEQQHARDGGGDEKTCRPQPADQRRHQEEGDELRRGEHEQPD